MTVIYPRDVPTPWNAPDGRDAAQEPTADEAQAVGIVGGSWPYGPNISSAGRRALVDWAMPRGYVEYQPRNSCLHHVVGQTRRCSALRDTAHEGQVNSGVGPWDHPTFWRLPDRSVLLLAQPYGDPRAAGYEAVAERWPVRIEITDAIFYGDYAVLVTPAS